MKPFGNYAAMNELQSIVVDATVGARWYLPDEALHVKAVNLLSESLRSRFRFHAPALFRYEVVGALKRACATRKSGVLRIQKSEAITAIEQLFALPIQIHSADVAESVEALDMACRFSKGHYDVLYLRLAQKLDCQLITADEKMIRAVPADFPRGNVCLLSDWNLENS
jgi:predicted nucleic acid-binding protein